MPVKFAQILAAVALILSATVVHAAGQDYSETLKSAALEIEGLRHDYPQLMEFSVIKHVSAEDVRIDYEYHTHEPEITAGWLSGVPHPDDDGIWFFIDFHDPGSTAQIHTQPMTVPICLGDKKVSFLILEGKATKPLYGSIWKILEKYGARECGW